MKTIKLTNTVTGEINSLEVNPNDPKSLEQADLELKSFEKELAKARSQVKDLAAELLSKQDYSPLDIKDSDYRWVWRAPVDLIFDLNKVREYIPENILLTYKTEKGSPLVKVQTGPLKEVLSQMVDNHELPDGAWEKLQQDAERKPKKPYAMLEKII